MPNEEDSLQEHNIEEESKSQTYDSLDSASFPENDEYDELRDSKVQNIKFN